MPAHRTSVSLFVITPLALVAVLQLGGCARTPNTPPPGGTYLSTSAGANFEQSVNLEAEEGNIARLTLAGSFRNPSNPDEIYVAANQDGIIFSANGGQTWSVIETPLASTLDIVALQNGTLVAAGLGPENEGFVIRSLDEGKSWQVVLTVPVPEDDQGFQFIGRNESVASIVFDIALDPLNPNRVFAGSSLGSILVGEQSAKVWRTFRTLDTAIFSSNTADPQNGIYKIIPSPHVQNQVLVITNQNQLWRIGEDSQEEIEIPRDLDEDQSLRTVSRNRSVLDASFIRQFPNALFVGVDDGAVLTRDGGQSWEKLNIPVEATETFNTVVVTASPTNPARLFVAINDVIYRSEDGGQAWNTFSLLLESHVITNLLINPSNAARVLAVTTPLRT